jgi:hypothetical protein
MANIIPILRIETDAVVCFNRRLYLVVVVSRKIHH